MDEYEHYSMRGDAAKHCEKEPQMNYPFTLPQGLTDEQIRKLLPLAASRKCKRWECHQCVKEFMEQDCHHDQLPIEPAPSVSEPNFTSAVSKNNRSVVEMIDTVEVLICTEGLMDAEAECITKKQQSEPKVFFDLNVPIIECDEALEKSNNHDPASEELAVSIPEHDITELVTVDEQQTQSLEASKLESSAKVLNNGVGNSNVSPSPEILVPGVNKRSSIKKARKYHSLSYLNEGGKREGSQNVPNSIPQCNKPESKNKKKMQLYGTVEEGPAGTKIYEATEDGSEQNRQNRTFDCSLPLKQNCPLANVSASPRRECNGKRKHSLNHDQNGNSDATVSHSSEKVLQDESRSIDLQLTKRRIFCNNSRTPLADADQSQRVEPAADYSQRVEPVGHKSKQNVPSSSERKESLITPVADHGNYRPTRIKKATSKAAYQLLLRKKQKHKAHGEPSGTALDKESLEKSSPDVAGKELVLQDKPISTINIDVLMPCLQNDNFNLKQLKSEIKTRLLGQGIGVKRLEVDSPSPSNNQNVIQTGENGTSSPIQSEKSSPKEVKRRRRPKSLPTSGIGTKKKQGNEQQATFGEELMVKDVTAVRPILPCEAALQLLSMVAVDTLENEAISDSVLNGTFLPIMEEFHVPPVRNVLEMGYEGCIEVTNPSDYFLVDGEGDRFKLGPEDLPLRPHRFLPAKGNLHAS